jgi:predicted RNA binding protein YcfA (HicA-like mRNA interferase family)
VRALQQAGFELVHVRGSHHYLRRPDGSRLVVVPVHGNRDLPVGTLRSVLRQAELTREELAEFL